MAEIQNRYYVDKVHTIRNNLQGHGKDPLEILKKKLKDNQASFTTKAVAPKQNYPPAEIFKVLQVWITWTLTF